MTDEERLKEIKALDKKMDSYKEFLDGEEWISMLSAYGLFSRQDVPWLIKRIEKLEKEIKDLPEHMVQSVPVKKEDKRWNLS